jgi:CYTH domain-containing protein
MPATPRYSKPEIERRWLVSQFPTLNEASTRKRYIEDRYILGTRLRLRKVTEPQQPPIYKLGKKYEPEADGVHQVVTIYLSEDEYNIFARLPAKIANKQRLSMHGGALDIYEFPEIGFHVFEMEFATPDEAAAYAPPAFASSEITNQPEYSGFALARSEA